MEGALSPWPSASPRMGPTSLPPSETGRNRASARHPRRQGRARGRELRRGQRVHDRRASRDASRRREHRVRSLLFATTTPPPEKLNAALVGAAAQLPLEIRAADLTGSPRGGLTALLGGRSRGNVPNGAELEPDPRMAAGDGLAAEGRGGVID